MLQLSQVGVGGYLIFLSPHYLPGIRVQVLLVVQLGITNLENVSKLYRNDRHKFPQAREVVFKRLVLFDQKSKTQRYSVNCQKIKKTTKTATFKKLETLFLLLPYLL